MNDELIIGSLVTMSDDNEYCVVDKFNKNGTEYIYLVDTNLEHKNFLFAKMDGEDFVELTDENEINMFLIETKKHIHNNEYFEKLINSNND